MNSLLAPFFFTTLYAFKQIDFIEDAFKYINKSVDPCENFYRHACSYYSPQSLVNHAFEELYSQEWERQKYSFWNKLEIKNDFESFKAKKQLFYDTKTAIDVYGDYFYFLCNIDGRSIAGFLKFIEKIVGKQINIYSPQTFHKQFTNAKCDALSNRLENELRQANVKNSGAIWNKMSGVNNDIIHLARLAKYISYHIDIDVRRGIEATRDMVEHMVQLARNEIKDTPWAKKKGIIGNIEKITSKLAIHDNYGKDLLLVTNALFEVESKYTKCKAGWQRYQNSDLFCYIYTAIDSKFPQILDKAFDGADNAMNSHPDLYFGFPIYYYNQYGAEMAAKLGYAGTTIAHEIGHTFFDKYDEHVILPGFSKQAEECVQNQFNSTCNEYREESCATTVEFLEENGADIFGNQLAYMLMEEYYADNITNIIDRLNVTYKQLFFYSNAFEFCSRDPSTVSTEDDNVYRHSANNVRVNVMVQLPAFREAFQCSSNSRMMMSATKKCFIYGSEAPETRKRKFAKQYKN